MKKLLTQITFTALAIVTVLVLPKLASAGWNYYGYSIPYVVVPPPPITVSLTATPTSMTLPANSTTLTWTTTGSPDSCTASNAWSGSKSASGGTQQISNLTAGTYQYEITCSKAGLPDDTDVATVVVSPLAQQTSITVSLSSSPSSVPSGGGSSTLTWSSNGTSCTGTNFSTNGQASGSKLVSLSSTTTYRVECTNGTNQGQAQTTVTVLPLNVINGMCASYHWSCSLGTSVNNTGTGPWSWQCLGSNGGSTASCTELSLGGGGGETKPQCSDGKDNDNDKFIDIEDPGCHSDKDPKNDASYLPDRNTEKNGILPIIIEN